MWSENRQAWHFRKAKILCNTDSELCLIQYDEPKQGEPKFDKAYSYYDNNSWRITLPTINHRNVVRIAIVQRTGVNGYTVVYCDKQGVELRRFTSQKAAQEWLLPRWERGQIL